jgi:hypothetical protein
VTSERQRLIKGDRCLRWLRHGRVLSTEIYGVKAGPFQDVWTLLVEAVEMIDRTPDRERGWLTSGNRAQVFGFAVTKEDIKILNTLLEAIGETTFSQQGTRVDLVNDDHERMLDVLEWLRYCDRARQPNQFRKVIMAMARGGDNDVVRKLLKKSGNLDRRTIHMMRVRAVNFIIDGLNKDFGIVYDGRQWATS